MNKARIKKELIDVMLLAFLGGLITVLPFCWDCGLEKFLANYLASASYWVVLAKGNSYLVDYVSGRIGWLEKPVKRFTWGVIVMLVFTILAAIFLFVFWRLVFSNQTLMEIISDISFLTVSISILITLVIALFLHARGFLFEWKDAVLKAERLKTENIKSKYESLKNQVNPHFLFNSLNVLTSLVYDDQKQAVAFIRKLSEVYRYVLENKDQEVVSIEDELKFLYNYTYLQKMRFGENLIVEVNDLSGKKGFVPPLAIQLLVENAIKHNIVSEAKPLKVSIKISPERVSIRNNIQEKLTKDSTGIGLTNLKARYEYLSDNKVEIINQNGHFEVILPLLSMKEL